MRPLAVLAPLALVPALLDPPPLVVAALAAICGFAVAGLLPMANGLFVRALPDGYRARAFGVMASGMQIIQGLAVLVTGLLAERFPIPLVVGAWSTAGVGLMLLATLTWPSRESVQDAISQAGRDNAAGSAAVGPQPRTPVDERPGDRGRTSHAVT